MHGSVYVLVVTFIIIAVSNGANLTDGIDGLAAGTSAIIGLDTGRAGLHIGQRHFCQIPQRHVHPVPR